MEMEYEENFKNVDELHAKQIQDLEANFQHKMMIEVAKYQKLAAEREREHEEWQKQHKGLLEAHQRKVAELQKKFEDQEADDRAHKTRTSGRSRNCRRSSRTRRLTIERTRRA